jgi:hypothetical protein
MSLFLTRMLVGNVTELAVPMALNLLRSKNEVCIIYIYGMNYIYMIHTHTWRSV